MSIERRQTSSFYLTIITITSANLKIALNRTLKCEKEIEISIKREVEVSRPNIRVEVVVKKTLITEITYITKDVTSEKLNTAVKIEKNTYFFLTMMYLLYSNLLKSNYSNIFYWLLADFVTMILFMNKAK